MPRVLWTTIVLLGVALPALAKTTISFEDAAVVARVTARTSTAWFSIEHLRHGYQSRITDRAVILADDDGDGIVRLPVEQLSVRSVWMVVDLSNGDYAIDSPAGYRPRRRPLAPGLLRARTDAAPAQLLQRMTSVVVWLVRPGVGAWVATIEDGAHDDADRTSNGEIAAALGKMAPVGNSPPAPDDLQRDDVMVAVEPSDLYVFDMRVVK